MAWVSTAVADPTDNEVNLYFSLKEGETADLEVVALAALEWLEGARAAAREIDPGSQVHIGLIDASEGSLKIRTVLKFVESHLERIDKGSSEYPRLRKLALALAIFVPTTGAQTYSYYFPPTQELALKAEDRALLEENNKMLRELLEKTQKSPEVEARRQKFFQTLARDTSITGAGLSEGPKEPPIILIPSTQFAEKIGLWAIVAQEDEAEERTIYPVIDVTLVSPTLLPIPRAWRFQPEGLDEFSATMRDSLFLAALASDHVKERLRTGIRMRIRLKVIEKRIGDVWVPKPRGRSVVEVIEPKIG